MSKIAVVGLGRVGLPLSLCLAHTGHIVYGIDIDVKKINKLQSGKVPFHEPDLDKLLTVWLGKRFFPTTSNEVLSECDASIVLVNTPANSNGFDDSDLKNAISRLAEVIRPGHLVILSSSVNPGTTEDLVKPLLEKISGYTVGKEIFLSYVPERIVEGQAIKEFQELPLLIGASDEESYRRTEEIFFESGMETKRVKLQVAELAKMLNNYWRDVTFAVSHEISLICAHCGLDAKEVIEAANYKYKRSAIPLPSSGVGGNCLPKDPWILAAFSSKHGFKPKILPVARELNSYIPKYFAEIITTHLNSHGPEKEVLVLGLAYKKDVDDIRNSQALDLIKFLKEQNIRVFAYDPYVADEVYNQLEVEKANVADLLSRADCIVMMTNHQEFSDLPLSSIKKGALFVDCWGMFEPAAFKHCNYIGWRRA